MGACLGDKCRIRSGTQATPQHWPGSSDCPCPTPHHPMYSLCWLLPHSLQVRIEWQDQAT